MPAPDNRFDRDHVAEEIEGLGKSERDAVESQIIRILEHFLKLAHSPADRPRYGWMRSIAEARTSIRKKMSPTLRREAEASRRSEERRVGEECVARWWEGAGTITHR